MEERHGSGPRRRGTQRALALLLKTGVLDAVHRVWPGRLTVFAYHRIADPRGPRFSGFEPLASATPEAFAAQMDFVRTRFNVVSMAALLEWIRGTGSLPPYPALITFDDGYRDNFECAWPVLRTRGLPATVFLTAGCVGSASPFYWDLVAYCFRHTELQEADLPLIGRRRWTDAEGRVILMARWLGLLKTLPDDEKTAAVNRLPETLEVDVPGDAFAHLYLTWDQVRVMASDGLEVGGHTTSHPILTRVPLERARREVTEANARIEAETGRRVTAFAYTNGLPADFDAPIQTMLREVGMEAAFTLMHGPSQLARERRTPLALRRIFVGHRDSLPRFVAKAVGLARLRRM